jgi:hypothetical protein
LQPKLLKVSKKYCIQFTIGISSIQFTIGIYYWLVLFNREICFSPIKVYNCTSWGETHTLRGPGVAPKQLVVTPMSDSGFPVLRGGGRGSGDKSDNTSDETSDEESDVDGGGYAGGYAGGTGTGINNANVNSTCSTNPNKMTFSLDKETSPVYLLSCHTNCLRIYYVL